MTILLIIQIFLFYVGGIILPLDHRHKISTSGSLTIHDVQKTADEGKYTCLARDPDGISASGSTFVSVVGKYFHFKYIISLIIYI